MKVVHGMRPEDPEVPIPEAQDFKICPICGATCFADMEVCFGCLHHFDADGSTIANRDLSSAQKRPEMDHGESKRETRTDVRPSEPSTMPAPGEPLEEERAGEIPPTPFDHMRDIPGLKKPEAVRPCSPRAHCGNAQDAMTSHHICSDGEGRQFEISITVKLL